MHCYISSHIGPCCHIKWNLFRLWSAATNSAALWMASKVSTIYNHTISMAQLYVNKLHQLRYALQYVHQQNCTVWVYPPKVFSKYFLNSGEFLNKILHPYDVFIHMLQCTVLTNYLLLWQSYARLTVTVSWMEFLYFTRIVRLLNLLTNVASILSKCHLGCGLGWTQWTTH